MTKFISWNVNGIRAAIRKGFLNFIEKYDPDILCLQETKVEDTKFPTTEITALGYPQQIIYEQKSYQDIAICSRVDLADGKRRDWSSNNRGRRLDHLWVIRCLLPTLKAAWVMRATRSWPNPSDHAPVLIDLDI